MAHLKKFSLAKKLSQMRQESQQVFTPLLFATGNDDCLFYSADLVMNMSSRKKKDMKNLLFTMQTLEIPYLSANQVGLEDRYFGMMFQKQNFKWSLLSETNLEQLLCVNPLVLSVSETTSIDWETNICFPFIRSQIERYDRIRLQFQTIEDEQEYEFEGFNARVVQQAIDSLNGYQIIDPRIHCGRWEINPKWKNVLPKTELTIDTYRGEIQKLVKSNPECFRRRSVKQLNKQVKEEDDEFSFEAMMMKRLEKYIKREMLEPAAADMDGQYKQHILDQIKSIK
ncbi:unnamed protein product [Paramecium primaurelia]|uniref:Peptide deformylase n=1 Tax=Paramecium primaurelia TaxID=5886 RepID=A0A8S1MNP9_PARPR|nr:unnamed protein product [Paramecium primaurelia]